jgi:sporulation protein YlmC with PRC-barrel domain
MFQIKEGQWRSSKLVGMNVYNNNNDDIGDINEIIVGKDGRIQAVVIGVGGFLGMGEHDVAVPFNQVKFVEEPRRDTSAGRTETRTDTRPASNSPAADQRANNPPNNSGPANPPANRDSNREANRAADALMDGVPDHAVVNMSKDQLKALPQVRYER